MYILLTTFPEKGSGNVGDLFIEESLKKIISHEKKEVSFKTIFREEDLTEHLEIINKSRAILMPAFAIRDLPMYPNAYRLMDDLDKIEVPLIPVGSNWNLYPGDYYDCLNVNYSYETLNFLKYISKNIKKFSCREYTLLKILERHNINNAVMTGDPAWYDIDSFGKEMKRPTKINKLVFSPPLSPFYEEQAKDIIKMLAELFPGAKKYCVFHLADLTTKKKGPEFKAENSAALSEEVTEKNEKIRECAVNNGFENRDVCYDLDKIDFYENCDLHVGYECHAHIAFFRKRIPSILIIEDARGMGFSYTFGVGGFKGFVRSQAPGTLSKLSTTSGYCTEFKQYSVAPIDLSVVDRVKTFIEEELNSGFRRYLGIASIIDDTYHSIMKPFINSLP